MFHPVKLYHLIRKFYYLLKRIISIKEILRALELEIQLRQQETTAKEKEYKARLDIANQVISLKEQISYQNSVIELHQNALSFLSRLKVNFEHESINVEVLVSIIMPVFNREKFIGIAIESILKQHHPNWELIIIDDGSVDDTKKIINHFVKQDPRIKYLYQSHQGVSAARNAGITKARGEYIAYLDSDNTWINHTLTYIVSFFSHQKDAKAAYFASIWHHEEKKWLFFPENLLYEEIIFHDENTNFMIIDLNCFVHHRDLFLIAGGFDESLKRLEDFDLIYRYKQYARIHPLPFIGTNYYYKAAANSLSHLKKSKPNLERIRKKYFSALS